ncbi:MAG: ribokinase [Ginsengibacter sp.]
MSIPGIIVIGSTNMDMVVTAPHIPAPGETVMADKFFMNPGGKGANQAVAVARLGGQVIFVSKLGNDVFGKQSSLLFDEEGIDTRYVKSDPELPSGVALITVDSQGENSIVVAAGANSNLHPSDLAELIKEIDSSHVVLMQLEIPIETVNFVAKIASKKGAKVILNPAPFQKRISNELLKKLFVITPNHNEAEMLSEMEIKTIDDAKMASSKIKSKGPKNVIITLGNKGAIVNEDGKIVHVKAEKVTAIDTTAAGDVFNGALCLGISEGKSLVNATRFACKAAAYSVTKIGAQSSIPFRSNLILTIK